MQNSRKTARSAASRRKNPLGLILIGGIVFIILCWILQSRVFPNGMDLGNKSEQVSGIDATVSVRITEVMSSNSSILQDDTGAYADWLEITNTSGSAVNLYGWKLAKNTTYKLKYFEFPNHVLESGEKVLVYCTSTTRNNYGYAYHAPFKISAAGDTVILFNPAGTAVQTLNVPEMTANQSYADFDGSFSVTDKPTPMLDNTPENYELIHSLRKVAESPIKITEIMAKNCSYVPDENGEYPDWVEIYNSSSYSISLAGYSLTDSEINLRKWTLPNISLGAGEYMIVYCSGYDRRSTSSPLHTSFRLSTEKEGVILTDANGNVIDSVSYDLLKADQSYSRQSDDSWTTNLPPTPGMANTYNSAALISGQFAAQNTTGVIINEVVASNSSQTVSGGTYDWVEIRNTSSVAVDLSGWGVSDNPSKPRKWQFPEGTVINPGSYMAVIMSGLNKTVGGYMNTNFRLSATEGETLVLSDPEGKILDRCPLGMQYADMSYGRIDGRYGFYYLSNTTPNSANSSNGYEQRMLAPSFSVKGGLYGAGEVLTVEILAEPDATIYYTLDSSEPDPTNLGGRKYDVAPEFQGQQSDTTITYRYDGPITVTATTVIRAIAVKNGQLPSLVSTETYFIGVNHTLQVVSLVMNPEDMFSYTKGIYVKGPNAYEKSPYGALGKGANFWMTWEKAANVELFGTDGSTVLSQGCGVRLHGQFSRKEKQKSFKIIARSEYGVSKFFASLFPNRSYTEYQSFLLRQSGQDVEKTRMRDSILTSLAEGMGVMYQDTALCVVYINGQYWGQYNIRERINPYSICQWMGWDPAEKDSIDLLKANSNVMQGSNKNWLEFKDWYTKNGIDTDEELAVARTYIDVENYLNYVAVEIYTGNTDLLNCKKYRNTQQDGLWRWILFDFDWAFTTDTNSVGRWLKPGGVGDGNKCDNSLFIALMKNPYCRDYFLSLFAEKLRTTWSSDSVIAMMKERYNELDPEMDMHLERWGLTRSTYEKQIKTLVTYAQKRPGRLLYFFKNAMSKSDFEYYFGDIAAKVDLIDDKGKSFPYAS